MAEQAPVQSGLGVQEAPLVRSMNSRRIKPLPTRPNPVKWYVYNVSTHRIAPEVPWSFEVCLGDLGMYHIPSCEEGKPYSTPLEIRETVYNQYDNGVRPGSVHGEIDYREIDGLIVANEIAGINPPIHKGADRTKWGVFVSGHNPPLPEELKEAHRKLKETYQTVVRQADLWWEIPAERANITTVHTRAAHYLNIEREWCKNIPAQQDCKVCGTKLNEHVSVCRSCGAILDIQRAAELGHPEAIRLLEMQNEAKKKPKN